MGTMATDADLIAGSLVDGGLFTQLFDRHFLTIHRFASRRLGSELATRVAERTFIQAFRRRHAYGGKQSVRAWLFGIATKEMRRYARRERRRLRSYARRGPGVVSDSVLAARERGAPRGVERRLARELASLAPGDRDVLLLGAWAGLAPSEVADALDYAELSE